jgi:hypothetical protein
MICLVPRLQQASPNTGVTGVGEADSNTPTSGTKSGAVNKNSSSGASSPLHQLLQQNSSAFSTNVSTTGLSSSPTHHLQLDTCGMFSQSRSIQLSFDESRHLSEPTDLGCKTFLTLISSEMKHNYLLNLVKYVVFLTCIAPLYSSPVHKKVYVNMGPCILHFGAVAYLVGGDVVHVWWPHPHCKASSQKPFPLMLKYFLIQIFRLEDRLRQTNCMIHKVHWHILNVYLW